MNQDSNSASTAPTTIVQGSKVKGSITGKSPLRIEGEVDGRIHLEAGVIVAASGRVKGEIHAQSIQVAGRVTGNVKCVEKVEVLAGGSLEGDVSSPRFIIIEGAFYKGGVEMSGEEPAAAARRG